VTHSDFEDGSNTIVTEYPNPIITMRIVYSGWFLREGFKKTGCEVIPFQLDASKTLNELVEETGTNPDIVFIELFGQTALPKELHNSRYKLAVYCIDSSLNEYWLIPLAKLCTFVYVDQLSSVSKFSRQGVRAQWLPLCVSETDFRPVTEIQHFITFVGRVTQHRVKRANLLSHISKSFPLNVVSSVSHATMLDIFAASRIVLNENFFSGLNLRFFQALASGSLLLTERRCFGVRSHFREGVHFVGYSPNDILATLGSIEQAYENYVHIASSGQEECRRHHTSECRARTVIEDMASDRSPAELSVQAKQTNEGQSKYFHVLRFGGHFDESVQLLKASADGHDTTSSQASCVIGSILLRSDNIDMGVFYLEKSAAIATVHGLNATFKLMLFFLDDSRFFKYLSILIGLLDRMGLHSPVYFVYIRALRCGEDVYYNTCMLAHAVLFDVKMNYDLGFNRPNGDRYPEYAMEYARLAFLAHITADSLEAIIKSTNAAGVAPEALDYITEAILAGVASDEHIALSASLAIEYFDFLYASTAIKALKASL
jgi:hypothetical protein